MKNIYPDYWSKFIVFNSLIGQAIEIPWPVEMQDDDDDDDFNAIIEILDEALAKMEATELYPGCEVVKYGFIPVGGCGYSSGDGYFINKSDGPEGPLYLISHETIIDDSFPNKKDVIIMLNSYTELLKLIKQ